MNSDNISSDNENNNENSNENKKSRDELSKSLARYISAAGISGDINDVRKKLELQLQLDKDNNRYRAEYQKREKELEDTFAKKERQLIEREKSLQADWKNFKDTVVKSERDFLEQKNRLFQDRANLEKNQTENDNKFRQRLNTLEEERRKDNERLEESIKKVEAESAQSKQELNDKISRSSKTYITEALSELKSKEKNYKRLSFACNCLGGIALAVGLIFFICLAYSTVEILPEKINWEIIVFLSLKGLISVSLLVGFARYAYVLSTTYLKEALKISDRMHAISFGKFYLDSYGSTHDWEQVKEVFENWNINNTSTIPSTKEDDVDLASIDKATTIIERIANIMPRIAGKAE